jgi:hypothetical protein
VTRRSCAAAQSGSGSSTQFPGGAVGSTPRIARRPTTPRLRSSHDWQYLSARAHASSDERFDDVDGRVHPRRGRLDDGPTCRMAGRRDLLPHSRGSPRHAARPGARDDRVLHRRQIRFERSSRACLQGADDKVGVARVGADAPATRPHDRITRPEPDGRALAATVDGRSTDSRTPAGARDTLIAGIRRLLSDGAPSP